MKTLYSLFFYLFFSRYIYAQDLTVEELHAKLPEPLQLSTFDSTLESDYHIVEFFSPFCIHCKQLLPIWTEFFEENNEELSKNAKVFIHQVDCVVSGDLCDREGIKYFPQIRFYGPKSKLLASMSATYKRTAEGLLTFTNDQLMNWHDDEFFENGLDPLFKENHLLSGNDLLKIISGENIQKPVLVSFWPSTDEQLNEANFHDDHKTNKVFSKYENCYSFRNMLDLSMKNLKPLLEKSDLSMNFFNCKSNPNICRSLGFSDLLTNNFEEVTPKIILYLPKDSGGNAIRYNGPENPSAKHLVHWTRTTLINAEFRELPFRDISSFLSASSRLDEKSHISAMTDYSSVGFVFVNDPNTAVPEDDILINHLLQPVADLPNNVFLLKTNDKDKVLEFIRKQEENLANIYVNLELNKDDKGPERKKFDESIFISRTLTTFPMIVCIKSGSIFSPVLQSFGSKNARDFSNVMTFIERNSFPIIEPLSSENKDIIFPKYADDRIHDKTEKVLLTLVDFTPKSFFHAEYYMSFVYHRFMYINNEQRFQSLQEKRTIKHDKVDKMKANDADSVDIIQELKNKINNVYLGTDNYLYPIYIEPEDLYDFAQYYGWSNIDTKDYKTGDSILISRFGNEYWDKDLEGQPLNFERPMKCADLIYSASFSGLKGQAIKSRWWSWLVPFYFGVICIGYVLFKMFRKWGRHRELKLERMKGLGILGLDPENDSGESKID